MNLQGAIETVVHDAEIRNNLIKKGFKQAAGFTWDNTARKTLEVFKKTVNSGSRLTVHS